MDRSIFRVMGGLLLSFTAVFAIGAIATGIRYVSPGYRLRAFLGWGSMTVLFIVVGIGLLHLRKWAALSFSLMAGAYAFLMVRQAYQGIIHPIPGRADWLGFLFALILSIPIVVTVKGWRALVWCRASI